MDVCKVITDALHFVSNYSTALILGILRLGPLEGVELFCLQTRHSEPAVNQPTKCEKQLCIFLPLLIKLCCV